MNVHAMMSVSDVRMYNDNTGRANVVVNYFQDRCGHSNITQTINRTLRDFKIYAAQFEFTEREKTTEFVSNLDSPVQNFFSTATESRRPTTGFLK